MSNFSGKCDVYDDFIEIWKLTDDYDWSKVKVKQYVKGSTNTIDLVIKNVKDIIPYSAHIVTASSSRDGNIVAIISSASQVDYENEQSLNFDIKRIQKEYKKCKKENREFIVEEVAKKISFTGVPNNIQLELCKRAKEHPYAKDLANGLVYPLFKHEKNDLVNEMVKYGYTKEQAEKWCFDGKKTW